MCNCLLFVVFNEVLTKSLTEVLPRTCANEHVDELKKPRNEETDRREFIGRACVFAISIKSADEESKSSRTGESSNTN